MLFFWRQPKYQSDLDHFLHQMIKNNPELSSKKETGLNLFGNKEPFNIDQYILRKKSMLRKKANPYF